MTISLASWFLFVQPKPHPPMTNSVINPQKQLLVLLPCPALLCIIQWQVNGIGHLDLIIILIHHWVSYTKKISVDVICFNFVLQKKTCLIKTCMKLYENFTIVVQIRPSDQQDIQVDTFILAEGFARIRSLHSCRNIKVIKEF